LTAERGFYCTASFHHTSLRHITYLIASEGKSNFTYTKTGNDLEPKLKRNTTNECKSIIKHFVSFTTFKVVYHT